jgi:phage baseplate assembly protein W
VAIPDESFLGRGWAYPLALADGGDVAEAAGAEDIRQSLRIILGTATGERLMRPGFGCGLRDLVFEPADTTTQALARHRVETALIEWEPRIDLLGVTVTAEGSPPARLLISIDYRVRATNAFYNLVYPFYLLERSPT